MKREPLDKWSVREQLCLVSAVNRSGDQNWMSVSRALKPFGEPNRPSDWFHQKNCAAQFGVLLANVDTPKRKKGRTGGNANDPGNLETPVEAILRKLLQERQAELRALLAEERAEYSKVQEDMTLIQSGKVTEDQLDIWCREIDEEEQCKEEESLAHAQWLREREQRKQEIEKAWRPKPPSLNTSLALTGQKRKHSDSIDSLLESESLPGDEPQLPEGPKQPALSPLLTSLLKSPSQVSGASLHHPVALQQKPVTGTSNTNPMISSLLNSTANVSVSPRIQQLVSSAIGQGGTVTGTGTGTVGLPTTPQQQTAMSAMDHDMIVMDDQASMKIDDIASTMLVGSGPLPEIKEEEVDNIISDLIESSGGDDLVANPEGHLQLDANGDISINLDIVDELEDEGDNIQTQEQEIVPMESQEMNKEELKDSPISTVPIQDERNLQEQENTGIVEKIQNNPPVCSNAPTPAPVVVDPFEFQEDPEIYERPPSKSMKHQHLIQQSGIEGGTAVEELHQRESPVLAGFIQTEKPLVLESQDTITGAADTISTQTYDSEPQHRRSSTDIAQDTHENDAQKEQSDLSPVKEEPAAVTSTSTITSTNTSTITSTSTAGSKASGSVEIVEVISGENDDIGNQNFNRSQIEDIVHSSSLSANTIKQETTSSASESKSSDPVEEQHTVKELSQNIEEEEALIGTQDVSEGGKSLISDGNDNNSASASAAEDSSSQAADESVDRVDIKTEEDFSSHNLPARDFRDEFMDDIGMEIKVAKGEGGRAKRDYSRKKKQEDKDSFDILLAIERKLGGASAESAETEDMVSEMTLSDDKDSSETAEQKDESKDQPKASKVEERSSSPWTTEEDEEISLGSRDKSHTLRRRLSTPATPMSDSPIPNSPASSGAATNAGYYDEDSREYRNWKKSVLLVFSRLTTHKYASLFLKPITDEHAPGYHSLVYRPTDLSTIRRNIENGTIRTTIEFQRDVQLMFTNAIMFNKTGDVVFEMARQMQQDCLEQIQILLQAQSHAAGDGGTHHGPFRRETRCAGDGYTPGPPMKRKRREDDPGNKGKKRKDVGSD